MTEFKFRGKTYKVVPDSESTHSLSVCYSCAFENDMDHRCTKETDMEYLDGTTVGPCSAGEHHYVEVKDAV